MCVKMKLREALYAYTGMYIDVVSVYVKQSEKGGLPSSD